MPPALAHHLPVFADLSSLSIPTAVALSVVAAFGYLFGRQQRVASAELADAKHNFQRAHGAAIQLRTIADSVRKNIANHHMTVARFKDRIRELSERPEQAAWHELCTEADELLKPTHRLEVDLVHAYDQLRQQSRYLLDMTEHRVRPVSQRIPAISRTR